MVVVTSRWQVVPLKYFCLTSETKFSTVHGAAARSSLNVILPRFVVTEMVAVPFVATWLVGALTLRAAVPAAVKLHTPGVRVGVGVGEAVGVGVVLAAAGVFLRSLPVATMKITITSTSTTVPAMDAIRVVRRRRCSCS